MPVPFKEGADSLGEILITIAADDTVTISKPAIVELLGKTLNADELARLAALPDERGVLTLQDMRDAGFAIRLDASLLEIVFESHTDQRARSQISLSRKRSRGSEANVVPPAALSGYMNIRAIADYIWEAEDGRQGFGGTRFDLDAVLRYSDIVLESEAIYEANGDTDRDIYGNRFYTFQNSGLKRRGTRVVYDLTDSLVRIQAGDTRTLGTSFQRTTDALGIAIEKSPRKLAPGENLRPTGRKSFRIERPSDVDVLVNGSVMHSMRLRPGHYDLSDLPLRTGANDIELVITDDAGGRQVLSFAAFSDLKLLAPGLSEWFLGGGMPSYLRDGEITYLDDTWYGSGFYRLGLTDLVTGEIHAQADNHVIMGGFAAFMASPVGLLSLNAAASAHTVFGFGGAVSLGWEHSNFRGWTGGRESFRLSAEYRSRNFSVAGETVNYAEFELRDPNSYYYVPYSLRLSGFYSFPVTEKISGTISGRYLVATDTPSDDRLNPYQVHGDRYGLDLSISTPISRFTSLGLSAGYSNELYGRAGPDSRDPAFRVGVRLHYRPDSRTSVAGNYDSLGDRTYISAVRREDRGLDRWDANLTIHHADVDDHAQASASVGYQGPRGELRLSHSIGVGGIGYDSFILNDADNRTSLQAGVSLAFADGHVAIGAPIRGNGFAVVYPHDSIADREIFVGTESQPKAHSDWLGPALVPDVPAYTRTTLPVDVADLPVGYSLGAGAFELNAPYKAGYALQVGSDAAISAFGRLLYADGLPLSLLTGHAYAVGNPAQKIPLFTNAGGRFAIEGLTPGRWIVEMATGSSPARFAMQIPAGTEGLHTAGDLRPMEAE